MLNLSNKIQKFALSKLLFYVLIFLLPIQTRKVFLSRESFYFGFHAFYNTFYFYLTDIVVFSLIMTWLLPFIFSPSMRGRLRGGFLSARLPSAWRRQATGGQVKQDKIYLALGSFWLILAISTIVSRETMLSFYGFLKVSEFLLLFVFIRENVSRETSSSSPPYEGGERVGVVFWIFLASMSFQAILGLVQYLGQNSLGLKLLGEELLRPGMKNIAEFVSHGIANPVVYRYFAYLSPISDITVNLRAYGTFSHPNVFAGLLFAGILLNLELLFHRNKKIVSAETIFLCLSLILLTTGLVVTFSRFAIVLTVIGIIAWFFVLLVKIRKPQIEAMHSGSLQAQESEYHPGNLALIVIVLLASLGFNLFLFNTQIKDRFFGVRQGQTQSDVLESLGDRALLADIAVKMIKQKPLLGVGLRNFVVRMDDFSSERLMPYFHQPVHNIFLLVAAESGIPALIIFLLLLFFILQQGIHLRAPPVIKYTLLIIFVGFLGFGLVDHFPLALQQGSLAFWLTAGMLAAKK